MGATTKQPDLSGVSPEVKEFIEGISKGYDEMVEQLEKATKVIEELTDEDDTSDDDADDDEDDDEEPPPPPTGKSKRGKGVGKSADDDDGDDDPLTDLLKTHPALAEMLSTMKKTADDATDRADKAEKMAKAERDVRLTAEFITKAKTLDALAIESEPVAKALREMAEKVSKDTNEAIWKALVAANEQARSGRMFDELGSSAPGAGETQPGGKLDKAARKIMSDDKVSYADALTKAVAADPSLYNEYVHDVRNGA